MKFFLIVLIILSDMTIVIMQRDIHKLEKDVAALLEKKK